MKDVTTAAAKKVVIGGTQSKFSLKKKADSLLSEESALAQVMELLEFYDIDVDTLPSQAAEQVESALKQIVTYIRRGRVEILRDTKNVVNVQLTLIDGETVLVFSELNAKHKLVMDRAVAKGGGNYEKIYSLMASLAGLPLEAVNKLNARDLSVIEVLGMIFLAA